MEANLRFQDGNVIVKLSSSPRDWLLLHKDVLIQHMPGLGAGLKSYFLNKGSFTAAGLQDGEVRKMYVLSAVLRRDSVKEDTIMLEQSPDSKDDEILNSVYLVRFARSDMSDETAKEMFSDEYILSLQDPDEIHTPFFSSTARPRPTEGRNFEIFKDFVNDMKVLFSLLYGQGLDIDALSTSGPAITVMPDKNQRQTYQFPSAADVHDSVLERIASIAAYAQTYLCYDVVLPRLVELLGSTPLLYQCIETDPCQLALVGQRLKSSKIFFDARRHCLGLLFKQGPPTADGSWELHHFHMDSYEFCYEYEPQYRSLLRRAETLVDKLARLQLVPAEESVEAGGRRFVSSEEANRQSTPAKVLGDTLARSMWGQELASRIDPNVDRMIELHRDFHTNEDEHVSRMTALAREVWPTIDDGSEQWKAFEETTRILVREKKALIIEAFPPGRTFDIVTNHGPTAVSHTAWSPTCSDRLGFWTYVALEEDTFSHVGQYAGGGPVSSEYEPASEAWLKKLGFE